MNLNPEFFYFDELESTNKKLRKLEQLKSLPDFSAVMAGYQIAGRGQTGNKWESERGQNLTFSVLMKPVSLEVNRQFLITRIVTLALTDWLSKHIGNATIKWPNDIYAGDRKIAGILIENSLSGKFINNTIVGIGLNINQKNFVSDAPNPVSLKMITGFDYSLETVFGECIDALITRYMEWLEMDDDTLLNDQYMKRLFRRTGFYSFRDSSGIFSATIHNVESDGHLILSTSSGEKRRYAFKEVSFVL